MKKYFILALLCCITIANAQETRPFDVKIYNEEYQLFIKINLYENDLVLDGEDSILGEMSGFLWTRRDTRKWFIMESELISEKSARLTFINDFGSEDFNAILTYDSDGGYTLHRHEGSRLKIVVNKKYVNIPKTIRLFRSEK